MEDFELLSNIIIEYKYSKKQLKNNILLIFIKEYDLIIDQKEINSKLERVIFNLEMLFYEAENEILMRYGYVNGKISLNLSNITKGKYKNRFYFSDLIKIKEELL